MFEIMTENSRAIDNLWLEYLDDLKLNLLNNKNFNEFLVAKYNVSVSHSQGVTFIKSSSESALAEFALRFL